MSDQAIKEALEAYAENPSEEQLEVSLKDIKKLYNRARTEQEIINEQVRELKRRGFCSLCGAEQRGDEFWQR